MRRAVDSGVADVVLAVPELSPGVTPGRSQPSRAWDRYDVAIMAGAAVATFLVHPVRQMLRHPFWVDEAWVAALTRAPIAKLPRLTSSAPLGFVGLLKLVPGSGMQRGRLVVLGFSVLTVIAAYVLTRSLPWKRRATARAVGATAALVVMLAPVSLIRNDLKQYTCDAFCALVILAMGDRAERHPTTRSLAWLGIVAVVASPFSSTALFVSVAVFAGLLASAAIARARRRALEILVAGIATGGALAVYFAAAVAPNLNDKLRAYWASQYLTGSPQHMLHVSWNRLVRVSPQLAMPAAVFVVLFVLGIVVLVRIRARALAVTIPLLWFEMALMGRLQRYPFLDLRTAHFLLVVSLVVAALGAVGVVWAVWRLPFLGKGPAGWIAASTVGVLLATFFTTGFVSSVGELHIPFEDVRSETTTVAAQLHAHDVILVSQSANFGFAYYWPHGHVRFHEDDSGQGFGVQVAGLDAIYLSARTYKAQLAGLSVAEDHLRHAGPGAVLYIVRTHLSPAEEDRWQRGFAALGLKPEMQRLGNEMLLTVRAPGSGTP